MNKLTKETPKDTITDKPFSDIYENTTTLRFGANIEDNPFQEPSINSKSNLNK